MFILVKLDIYGYEDGGRINGTYGPFATRAEAEALEKRCDKLGLVGVQFEVREVEDAEKLISGNERNRLREHLMTAATNKKAWKVFARINNHLSTETIESLKAVMDGKASEKNFASRYGPTNLALWERDIHIIRDTIEVLENL